MIRVFYDNTIFRLQKIGGISIVFSELIKRLKNSKDLDLHIIKNGTENESLVFDSIAMSLSAEAEPKLPKFLLAFLPLIKKLPANIIFHTTYTRYSFQKNIKRVITIHDFGYEHGVMRQGIKRFVHLFFKKIAIKNADAIICVSKKTYDDLYFFYRKILTNKLIKVIYNGLDDEFFNVIEETQKVTAEKYILYVGGRQAYKNFEKAVDAVSELKGFNLVVAGGGRMSLEHIALLEAKLKNRYQIKLDLSTIELKKVYCGAYCLVYPSSYEGFGLPLLEAMAAGCPVISCDNSCIPEITNDAAILISSPDVSKIKQAIKKLEDQNLRFKLIEMGKINATRFSWNNTAEETIKLYKNLMGNN